MRKTVGNILLSTGIVAALTACGGGGGGNVSINISTSSSAPASSAPAVSSSSVVSSSSAVSTSSSSSSSLVSSSSSLSTSSAASSTTPLKDLASFPIGIAVEVTGNNSLLASDAQKRVVAHHFDQLTAGNEMKMSYLQSSQGTFHYTNGDNLVTWGEDNGLRVHGHALVWHSSYQVPNFFKTFSGSKEDFLALVANHAKTVATHFAGKVDSWDVVNEALLDSGEYRNTGDEGSVFYQKSGKDYIATAFRAAREGDSDADLYYNDFNTEQNSAKTDKMIEMVEELLDDGVPITGIGFQMHVMLDWPNITNIKASFKKAADLNLMVKITELDVPINNPYNGTYNFANGVYEKTFTTALANRQKQRYCEIVKAYLEAVPEAQRGGITIWGVADNQSWLISQLFKNNHTDWPLLFDNNYNEKPALHGVADALSNRACSAN